MLTPHLPTLLALLGTLLMAVVIFAPAPAAAPKPAPPERYSALPFEALAPAAAAPEPPPQSAAWPLLLDPCAARCDVAARLALVDALAAVRTSWAGAILERALDDEPDPRVRAAIDAARIV